MFQLYDRLIKPRSADKDIQNRELVLNYIVLGLISLIILQLINLVIGLVIFNRDYLIYRFFTVLIILALFSWLFYYGKQRQKQRLVGMVVTLFFLLASASIVVEWGTVTPFGIILFGLVIVMGGILLGARYSLFLATISTIILIILEYLKSQRIVEPNLTWMRDPSTMNDVAGFGFIYGVIALVSWLFNRQMEQALIRAHQSELALSKQNDSLEATLKRRNRQLEAAQLEKVQQVYRFAEMGRLSSALFHDLANHLTSVSLGIEGLNDSQQSALMQRVQTDIHYIDDIVQRVRLQLRGQGSVEQIEVVQEVTKVAQILNYKLVQSHIKLEFQKPSDSVYWQGDVVPFRQIIHNLLNNSIEAYDTSIRKKKAIIIKISANADSIIISVTDWGVGIVAAKQAKVFDPFYSSKKDGTGIGLYIVKQIVERDLAGKIKLTSSPQKGTVFTVELKRSSEK
jgi:signal transduction histidine kinase